MKRKPLPEPVVPKPPLAVVVIGRRGFAPTLPGHLVEADLSLQDRIAMDYEVDDENDVRRAESVVVYLNTFLMEDEELALIIERIASVDQRKLTFVRESDPWHGGLSARDLRSMAPEALRRVLPSSARQCEMRHEIRFRKIIVDLVLQSVERTQDEEEFCPAVPQESASGAISSAQDTDQPYTIATVITLAYLMSM